VTGSVAERQFPADQTDFLTLHATFYAVAPVFVVMEIGSRPIASANDTTKPTLPVVLTTGR
jgi:hypothetical protein